MAKNNRLQKKPKGSRPPKTMTPEQLEVVAARFQVLADPTRLWILYNLADEELTVNELAHRTGGTQSNISKHLSTLRNHGLVERRPQGTSAFYSVADPSIFQLCTEVCGGIERTFENQRKAFDS